MKLDKVAYIVSDVQFPTYDEALWNTMVRIAEDVAPDEVIWNGDILDFPQLSAYAHNPYKLETADLDVSLAEEKLYLPMREATSDAKATFLLGNHEDRIRRYSERNAGALGDFDWLSFMRLGWVEKVYEYGPRVGHFLTPDLMIAHGWRTGESATKNHMMDVATSIIHAHTHQLGSYFRSVANGRVMGAWAMGHCCDALRTPGTHGQGRPSWQQAAGAIVRYTPSGAFTVELLPVIGDTGDKVAVEGRVYRIHR